MCDWPLNARWELPWILQDIARADAAHRAYLSKWNLSLQPQHSSSRPVETLAERLLTGVPNTEAINLLEVWTSERLEG